MTAIAHDLMPVSFQGLVVENTSVCNAKCGMCYQSAGPKGSDVFGRATLSPELVVSVIRDAYKVETLRKRFHLAGGEAFLKVEDCIYLFSVARDTGYTDITTTTNAFWAKDWRNALSVCERARAAGLLRMEISWDHWHLPYISPEAVSNCLEACAQTGIRSNLRILTSKSHSCGEALSTLRPEALAVASEISSCPVFPTGRAIKQVNAGEFYVSGDLAGTCHSVLHLTVNAQGNVYPCCAGADQTDWLSFGNVREKPIDEIANYMNHSRLLRVLVFRGPGALVPILEQAGIDIGDSFTNICHVCWEIFSKPEHGRVIHDYFERLDREAVTAALASLGPHGSVN